MARAIKLCPILKELRIHLCPKGESSEGVREFLHKHYVSLKKENPKFPILIRECSGIQPKLWARYGFGKEKCSDLSKVSAEEVMNRIIALNSV